MNFSYHNDRLKSLCSTSYSTKSLAALKEFLYSEDALRLYKLDNGLFPAAVTNEATSYTGYSAVWVRDNVFMAFSCFVLCDYDSAAKTLRSLFKYFLKHSYKLENIIQDPELRHDVMMRPHVRFDGNLLEEIPQNWQHVQNDALGYFLWLACLLIRHDLYVPTADEIHLLLIFVRYFNAICYWKDPDSGHWEEERKVSASSIGVVVASLKELHVLCKLTNKLHRERRSIFSQKEISQIDYLIAYGKLALSQILPFESIDSNLERRYDAALLFLVYPLFEITGDQADRVIADVIGNLQGPHGISRYPGDTFWCKDYYLIPHNIRTSISSERSDWLDKHNISLCKGEEAQWCIFDSIISAFYAYRYNKSFKVRDIQMQTYYFNRALSQLTSDSFEHGGLKCPELYFKRGSEYVPNDATPLLWSQGNLRIALKLMETSLSLS